MKRECQLKMNPSSEELQRRTSRVVPKDMLNDKDFRELLKDKARTTAPSSEDSEDVVPKKQRKRVEKEPPVVDPYDRDMIPNLEQRVNQQQKKSRVADLSAWLTWKVGVIAAACTFICVVLVKRWKMCSKLGLSYALAAELPFLRGFLCVFAGVSSQLMAGEIVQFEQGRHPILFEGRLPMKPIDAPLPADPPVPPKPAEEKGPDRKEVVIALVEEALCNAEAARGEDEEEERVTEVVDSDENEEETQSRRRVIVKRNVDVRKPVENNLAPTVVDQKAPPQPMFQKSGKIPGVVNKEAAVVNLED